MGDRKLLNPEELHPAPGFSHIATSSGSRFAFIAGQLALAPDFSPIGGDDLHAQTVAAMRNVEIALRAVDAGWDDVVRRTIFTTLPHEYEIINAAIAEVQGSNDHPAQSLIGVAALVFPGLLIEIECTALLP